MNTKSKLSINKSDGWLLLLSVFVPPIPVLIRKGFFSRDFLLNLLLFVFLWIPAIAHAAYVIVETSEERNRDFAPIPSHEEDATGPSNGDFDVDLESNTLPLYDDVVGSSDQAVTAAATDNKVQN